MLQKFIDIWTKTLCPICLNEVYGTSSITFHNHLIACVNCLAEWITLKISENQYTIDSWTPCSGTFCKKMIPLQEIYQKLPKSGQQRMNEALLQVYFSKEKDIRKCPKFNCQYAGIIDTKSSCTAPLQCELCGTQWRELIHFTIFEKIQDCFNNPSKAKAEDLSETWIKQKSKKCPSCKIKIEKDRGCDRMICKYCHDKFCWICLQRSSTHSPLIHYSYQYRTLLITIILVLLLVIYAVYSSGMIAIFKFSEGNSFWFILQVICAFFYGIFSFLWNFSFAILNFIVSNGFVALTLWTIFDDKRSFQTRAMCILGICAFIGFSYYANYFSTIFGVLKVDAVILLIAGLCFFAVGVDETKGTLNQVFIPFLLFVNKL